MTPLVKSTSRPKWQRMPNKYVYYYRSPQHQNHYVLSFAFAFDREEDVYQFAFSYPYSYSKCQVHLDLLEKKQFPHFHRELLATTVQQRRLDLVTITHPNNMPLGSKKQHVVVILSRIHPGESPASYVCQGLIDFLVSSHPIAQVLRDHVVFKIIPMMNPDGVYLGNYRSTLMGFDLNRTWDQISRWAHPTLHAVHTMLTELDQIKDVELDFVLDLHAHSSLLGVFVYERHIVFPKLLSQNAEDYAASNTMYNRDLNKAGTTRRYFCNTLKKSVNCYTLEVSFHGYQSLNTTDMCYYTEEAYCRLGRNVVRTYLDYYRVVGVVPAGLPTAPSSPEPRPRTNSSRSPSSRSRPRSRPHTTKGQAPTTYVLSLNDLEGSTSRESSPEEKGPRRVAAMSHERYQGRRSATIHYQQVPSPESQPPHTPMSAGIKSLAGRKIGGGGVICRSAVSSSAPRPSPPPPQPPRLSIIDFNQLTRGGLDQATGRARGQARGRARGEGRPRPRRRRARAVSSGTALGLGDEH